MKTLKQLKAERWRIHCPQLNLWAGLDGFQIVPCQSPEDPRVQVFDGRDNEDHKLRFYTAITGIKWEKQCVC